MRNYDGMGSTALWTPLALHGRYNPNRWNHCVDCGIDIGQYSKQYSSMFNRVTAIDACIRPEVSQVLEGYTNVKVLEKCLWHTTDDNITWYEVEGAWFLSTTNKIHIELMCNEWGIPAENIHSKRVTTSTIDSIIDTPVDFLKIDCEQSDTEILVGAKNIIEKYRPTIQIEQAPPTVLDFLKIYGYEKSNHSEPNCDDSVYIPRIINE